MTSQVLALFCDMVTNGNPERTEFQHTLDEVRPAPEACGWPLRRGSPLVPSPV
jgi:hypothetical protein